MNIPLGYEIGTGKRVAIPVNHTVVLGQTQLSGKTTTLEAMVTRSGLRAIGFITKPGEKSFRQQTTIPAFFSESTITDYWKYVVSIVENLMSVKLGWQERGWIVKLCQDYEDKTKSKAYKWKRPKALKELLANVRIALPHLRGTAEMICMQLQEYLESVVREIGQTEFSAKLNLETGINVMDVTELSDGLKALVIRSVIEHVHKHGRKTVIIIPEAWKFIPEGRSTPVKLALEGLIREGAGVGNFVWMDSQDLRGVDKLLLRSVIVWLFGVQRQKNEVASTLASIPDHPKPTATEIMQLGKGEFYVCYGSTLVRTYVQPAGMEDAHAQAIARGDESPDSWRQIAKALDEETGGREQEAWRQGKTETKADRDPENDPAAETPKGGLAANVFMGEVRERESADGDQQSAEAVASPPTGAETINRTDASGGPVRIEDSAPAEQIEELPDEVSPAQKNGIMENEETMPGKYITPVNRLREFLSYKVVHEEPALHEAICDVVNDYQKLIRAHDAMAQRLALLESKSSSSGAAGVAADRGETQERSKETPLAKDGAEAPDSSASRTGKGAADVRQGGLGPAAPKYELGDDTFERLFQRIKERAANDPGILDLLTRRPELRITIERQTIEANGGSLRGALALLISKKFFDAPQNGNAAFNELKRLGRAVAKPNVYRELDKLAELGFVTKEETGYKAVPGMKVHIIE